MVVNDEVERIYKEAVLPYYKVFQIFSGGTEVNHENPWSQWPILRLKFEPGTS
jgi:hypothetical protein